MQHGRNRKTSSYPQQPLAQRPRLDSSSPPLVNDVQGSIDVLDKSDSFAGDVLKTFFDVENMFLTEQLRDKDDLLVEPFSDLSWNQCRFSFAIHRYCRTHF